MLEAGTTIIEVAGGFPWASVVTGMVGALGIAGTWWQGNRSRAATSQDLGRSLTTAAENLQQSIRADDLRALRAEKIRVYSHFHAAIDDVFVTAVAVNSSAENKPTVSDLNEALTGIYKSAAEVRLIAPRVIGELATKIGIKIANEAVESTTKPRDFDTNNEVFGLRGNLYEVMTEDLNIEDG